MKNTENRKDNEKGNFPVEKIKNFLKKNGRYVLAVVLFVIVILIIVKVAGNKKDGNAVSDTEAVQADTETEELYSVNSVPAVNDLITNYYNSYANGDTDTLSTFVTPLTDNEKSFIQMYSQYVENYQNISCYTKKGLDESSYLVSAYLEIKFAGVDTLAPGLDFFYIQTNDDGTLYINNLYSQYNLLSKEQPLDSQVEALINSFEAQNDVVALQADVQSRYEAAINSDANLNTMINTTVYDAYSAWAQSVADAAAAAQAAADQAAADQAAADQAAADQAAADAAAQAPATETVYATDKVNVRDSADENGNRVGSVEAGTALTKTGDAGNGWTSIDYNGTTAYIKSDYLTTDQSAVPAAPAASVASGKEVMLSNSCNIRSSMSETADKVGVAYAGEKVTVVESYAEGWSKVSWNGQTGYIKTDLLQ